MKIFITGTDTNVGKTLISSWIALHTGFPYFKPIQTGTSYGSDSFEVQNRVESPFTETPSHTTVQAMSHTAVLLLCLPKANERLKSPNLLNHSRFIALCTI